MEPRLLAVVAHPDDEAFFFGGTLARCATRWRTRLVVVTDGAHGKQASLGADGRVVRVTEPATSAERHALGRTRRAEVLDSARALGVQEVEFLSWQEHTLGSGRHLLRSAIGRQLRAYDPTVVLTLSEAGTTTHADHSWVALLTHRAVLDAADGSAPSLAGYFTFTLSQAVDRFDYWGETVLPAESVVDVDVSHHVGQRLDACRAHRSQAHWLEYLDGLSLLGRPRESFVPRWLKPGGTDHHDLAGSPFAGPAPRQEVPMPLPDESGYSSSVGTLPQDIRDRVRLLDTGHLRAVVLASGHGTRMNNPELPKSLELVDGRPILHHILRALGLADVDESPVVVTGPQGELIRRTFGASCAYVDQGVPLGTGHAVACTRALLEAGGAGHVLVLNGDMPLVSPDTLRGVVLAHLAGDHLVTMGVVQVPGAADPRSAYAGFGRVVRDPDGHVLRVTEVRDADARTRRLTELNAGVYCFRSDWLWRALDGLDDDNAQAELYLTDVVRAATAAGERVATVEIPREDALGVNTRADLAAAEEVFVRRSTTPAPPTRFDLS